jgi:hypothetical protein
MGLGSDQLVEWPGPGLVYSKPAVGEISERLFYKHWQERIQNG